MLGDMKLHEKSSVFRRCLKISSEGVERAVDGKLFQARAAATLNAVSPTVERRVGGTTTVSVAAVVVAVAAADVCLLKAKDWS